MNEQIIQTPRLELHLLSVPAIIELFEKKTDLIALASKKFSNPHRVLINNSGPLGWRVPQVKVNPELNMWFIRFIVLKEISEVIGSVSFHSAPDSKGMIEIGLGIEEAFQGRGFAKEALAGMWGWVCAFPAVKTLRYTVSPDNGPSIAVINYFGFEFMGQQMDEIDGPENIYELSASDYLGRWGEPK